MTRVLVLGVALAALARPALAVDLAPDAAAIARAAADGRAMYKPSYGYDLADHVVYQVRDARAIDPNDGSVDAVVLATPLERTRHAAYFGQYQQQRAGAGARPIARAVSVPARSPSSSSPMAATKPIWSSRPNSPRRP